MVCVLSLLCDQLRNASKDKEADKAGGLRCFNNVQQVGVVGISGLRAICHAQRIAVITYPYRLNKWTPSSELQAAPVL